MSPLCPQKAEYFGKQVWLVDARNKAREAEPVAQRETPGGAMFVFCCNGRGCVFCDRF